MPGSPRPFLNGEICKKDSWVSAYGFTYGGYDLLQGCRKDTQPDQKGKGHWRSGEIHELASSVLSLPGGVTQSPVSIQQQNTAAYVLCLAQGS